MSKQWENLETSLILDESRVTSRLEVPGGWLYREHYFDVEGDSIAICFVPKYTEPRFIYNKTTGEIIQIGQEPPEKG